MVELQTTEGSNTEYQKTGMNLSTMARNTTLLLFDTSPSTPLNCTNATSNFTNLNGIGNETDAMGDTYGFWRIPQIAFQTILLLFIVIGNLSVLVAIGVSETGKKTRMNFFIMHLAISDLSVGLFLVTTELGVTIAVDWTAGDVMCRLTEFMKSWVSLASSFVLVALSIDRFDAIARPMNFFRRAFRARVLIYSAWITAAIFSIPMLVVFGTRTQDKPYHGFSSITFCHTIKMTKYWHYKLYLTLLAAVAFWIPAIIITGCYTVIIYIIWSKSRCHASSSSSVRSISIDTVSTGSVTRQFGAPCNVIEQAKIRTIKMTIIIVLVFVLCWCPFFVFQLVQTYHLNYTPVSKHTRALITFMMTLSPLNSAANPIIYGVFSTRICRNLRRVPGLNVLIKHICCCCVMKRHHTVSRMSHTSLNDGTAITEGSTKVAFRNGIKRTLSDTESFSYVNSRHKHGYMSVQTSSLHDNKKRRQQHINRTSSLDRQGNGNTRGVTNNANIRISSTLPFIQRTLSKEDCKLIKSASSKCSQHGQTDSNL